MPDPLSPPGGGAGADRNPAGQNPADQNSADKNPADQNPAGQNPANKNPADQDPAGRAGERPDPFPAVGGTALDDMIREAGMSAPSGSDSATGLAAASGPAPAAPPEPVPPKPSDVYISWASYLLHEETQFVRFRDGFPDLARPARHFDEVMAAMDSGTVTLVAFKKADDLSLTGVLWHLNVLAGAVPSPGKVDAIRYYGALVLVYEKPVNAAKIERILEMRRRSLFGKRNVQVIVIDLAARLVLKPQVPRLVNPILWPLEEAISRAGAPPPLPAARPLHGERTQATQLAVATVALIALLSAIHVWLIAAAADNTVDLRMFRGGAAQGSAIAGGQVWRMLTSNFIHFDWMHLFGNVMIMLPYGRIVESLFGAGWLFASFVLTGLGGSVLDLVMLKQWVIAAGASGGACGLAGVLLGVYFSRKSSISMGYRGSLFLGALGIGYIIFTQITNWAHVGGALSGLALGYVLPFKENKASHKAGRILAAASVLACVLAALALAGQWAGQDQPYGEYRNESLQVGFDKTPAFPVFRGETPNEVVLRHLRASIFLERSGMQMDHLFDYTTGELLKLIREKWPAKTRAGMRMEYLTVEKTRFGGLQAIFIRTMYFRKWTYSVFGAEMMSGSVTHLQDTYYIPQQAGSVVVGFDYPEQDGNYYGPIFQRFRDSFKSGMPPPLNQLSEKVL